MKLTEWKKETMHDLNSLVKKFKLKSKEMVAKGTQQFVALAIWKLSYIFKC